MTEKNNFEGIDLVFKEAPAAPEKTTASAKPHEDVGPSSLCGRVGDNVTYHAQGAIFNGYKERLWGWAWKELGGAFVGLLRLFSFRGK